MSCVLRTKGPERQGDPRPVRRCICIRHFLFACWSLEQPYAARMSLSNELLQKKGGGA
jgi:hypothetical protein